MEYITWNDCTIKINECSEIYMDFIKVFDIVSVQQERQSGKKREKYYIDLNAKKRISRRRNSESTYSVMVSDEQGTLSVQNFFFFLRKMKIHLSF